MQLQPNSDDALIDVPEAARRMDVSVRTVHNRIKNGTIPHVRLGKLIKFIPADLERFIRAHRIDRRAG
jgi:excisionase family DNA binding protein